MGGGGQLSAMAAQGHSPHQVRWGRGGSGLCLAETSGDTVAKRKRGGAARMRWRYAGFWVVGSGWVGGGGRGWGVGGLHGLGMCVPATERVAPRGRPDTPRACSAWCSSHACMHTCTHSCLLLLLLAAWVQVAWRRRRRRRRGRQRAGERGGAATFPTAGAAAHGEDLLGLRCWVSGGQQQWGAG